MTISPPKNSEEAALIAAIRKAAERLCELDCVGGVMDVLADIRFELGEEAGLLERAA